MGVENILKKLQLTNKDRAKLAKSLSGGGGSLEERVTRIENILKEIIETNI